ncbi:hypothetical protein [Ferruginibacter sp.]
MDIAQIRKYWMDSDEDLCTYTAPQLQNPGLLQQTIVYLTECGLPQTCAPFLSFHENDAPELQTPNQVYHIDWEELHNYLVIGGNGSGDPVCIDLDKDNEIVFLNHDNFFQRVFINTDIHKLLQCLIIYKDFIELINAADDSNFLNAVFNDADFLKLKQDLYNADSHCLDENTMWRWELDGLLAERANT